MEHSILCIYVFLGAESLAGVFNRYIFFMVVGVFMMFGTWLLRNSRPAYFLLGGIVFGLTMFLYGSLVLLRDLLSPYYVVEGRVANVRIKGGKMKDYAADISGDTVLLTRPLYERLKLKPVVRVYVGQGTDYVYRIDYLAN